MKASPFGSRLVIEIDGSQHYTDDGLNQDENRTKILEKYGIRVLRFSNREVDENFEGVCFMIDKVVKEQIKILSEQHPLTR